MKFRELLNEESIDSKNELDEGLKPDLKNFMKDFNQAVSRFKEDVKESDTNHNWVGSLEFLVNLCDKKVSEMRKR